VTGRDPVRSDPGCEDVATVPREEVEHVGESPPLLRDEREGVHARETTRRWSPASPGASRRRRSTLWTVAIDPDEYDFEEYDPLDERSVEPIQRSRAVRWTAILIVASFALAGLSSLSNWW